MGEFLRFALCWLLYRHTLAKTHAQKRLVVWICYSVLWAQEAKALNATFLQLMQKGCLKLSLCTVNHACSAFYAGETLFAQQHSVSEQ